MRVGMTRCPGHGRPDGAPPPAGRPPPGRGAHRPAGAGARPGGLHRRAGLLLEGPGGLRAQGGGAPGGLPTVGAPHPPTRPLQVHLALGLHLCLHCLQQLLIQDS